jgi:hypothetical protein
MTDATAVPTLAALERTGWREGIARVSDFVGLWGAFRVLGETAQASGDEDAKVSCEILAAVCSMIPADGQIHEPYQPMMRLADRRSLLPDDLDDDALSFLSELPHDLENSKLAARIADILWIRRWGPAPHQAAKAAVGAWLKVPITEESWYEDARENWPRYLQIARQLRLTDELEKAKERLELAFSAATGGMALDLADQLVATGVLEKSDLSVIASRLALLAPQAASSNITRQLCRGAANLYNKVGDQDAASDNQLAVVNSWVAEAKDRRGSSALAANHFLQSALKDYRQISGEQRTRLSIESLGSELASRIRDTGVDGLKEMATFTSPAIDLSDMAANIKEHVSNLSAEQAILRFVGLAPYLSEEQTRADAESVISGSFAFSVVPVQHFASDGRTIHTSAPDEEGPWGYPGNVWEQMRMAFQMHVQFVVKGRVLPALEVLINEHRLTVGDFLVIVETCPFVPQDREQSIARALAAGYNYDFAAALYMLVPQLENIVRQILRSVGAPTTGITEGIESEVGLSTLLGRPQAAEVLPPELLLELRLLFGGPTGPNLRNNVAHGLLSDSDSVDIYSVYAWWFLMRLVYSWYWNTLMGQRDNVAPPTQDEGESTE